jgi:hypothetical protein
LPFCFIHCSAVATSSGFVAAARICATSESGYRAIGATRASSLSALSGATAGAEAVRDVGVAPVFACENAICVMPVKARIVTRLACDASVKVDLVPLNFIVVSRSSLSNFRAVDRSSS